MKRTIIIFAVAILLGLGLSVLSDIQSQYDPDAGGHILSIGDLNRVLFGDAAYFAWNTQDANANCFVLDMPTGGAVDVPVFAIVQAPSDMGYFNGVTQPSLVIEDAAGTSYIRLSFSADGAPALTVGGVASTISIPGISAYSWTDNIDLSMGTGTDVAIEFTTADANAHCLLVDLPTGGADSVPVMILADADADFGYFNGVVEPTFAVENLAGTGYLSMDFSGTTLARLIAGGATSGLSVTGPVAMTHTYGAGAQTGTMSFAASTAAMTVNIATGTGLHTVHIADGVAANVVTVGSTSGAASLTLQSGTGDVAITSTDDITLTVNTAVTDNIKLTNTQGTAADAIAITATAGGVDIDAAATLDVNIAGGQVLLVSKDNAASAIALTANIGTSETIVLTNTLGTGEGALTFTATAGGMDFNAATGKNIDFLGGQFIFLSNENVASAFSVTTNTGTSETIVLTNTLGTSESAITLASTAGGVNVDAAAAKDLDLAGGQVKLVSKDDAASAISLTANIGTSETIVVTNTQGTSESAITLAATAGGVNVDAAAAKDLDLAGGQVKLVSKDDVAAAISLTANIGVSETITVVNTQGTAAGAIALTATAGGIAMSAAGEITATTSSGAGTVVGATCTAVEQSINGVHKTVLTIGTLGNIALEDKNDGNGIKIYDFPEGVISILGASCNLVVTSDGTITTSYVMSLGSAAAADGEETLTGTEANIIPSSTVTCGAGNEDFHGALVTLIGINGAASAVDLYINAAVAAGDISAGSNVTAASGTITIYWVNAGDY